MTEPVGSSALRLLQTVLEIAPGGRVFTSRDAIAAAAELGIGPEHTYKMLTLLTRRGFLERPRDGLYVMRPPLGGAVPVRPLVIAVRAVTSAAVSGDTALAHWGLLSQAPLHEEVVSTPARIQWRRDIRVDGTDRLWTIGGTTIRFRRVPQRAMFGITSVRLDSESVVPMFDRERALLELMSSVAWDELREPLAMKAAARDVTFAGPEDFLDPRVLRSYRDSWTTRLANVVIYLPAFDDALVAFQTIIGRVFGSEPPLARLD